MNTGTELSTLSMGQSVQLHWQGQGKLEVLLHEQKNLSLDNIVNWEFCHREICRGNFIMGNYVAGKLCVRVILPWKFCQGKLCHWEILSPGKKFIHGPFEQYSVCCSDGHCFSPRYSWKGRGRPPCTPASVDETQGTNQINAQLFSRR